MLELKTIIDEIDENVQAEELKKSLIIEMFDVRDRINRSLEWDKSQIENRPESDYYLEDLKREENRLKLFDTIVPQIVEYIKGL